MGWQVEVVRLFWNIWVVFVYRIYSFSPHNMVWFLFLSCSSNDQTGGEGGGG